jgi:hypothetical protein
MVAACASIRWEILLLRLLFFRLPQAPDLNLSWDEGLELTTRSMRKHRSEALNRDLVMRAYRAWNTGKIPRWTCMWLIDRGERLPANYKLGRRDDGRYDTGRVYGKRYSSKSQENRIFVDGKNSCVESYSWDKPESFCFVTRRNDVPIYSLIWKLRNVCDTPRSSWRHTLNRPRFDEHFLGFCDHCLGRMVLSDMWYETRQRLGFGYYV